MSGPGIKTRFTRRASFCALAFVVIMALPSVASATELPSAISTNMTLTPAGGPYTGSSTIESGAIVTIEAGTELETGQIVVKGTLSAEGTAESPVVFNGNHWGGIVFKPGSGASVLSYAELIKAGWSWEPSIKIIGSSPHITHSVLRESTYYGIFVEEGGSPEIDHNTITGSGGMAIYYGSAAGKAGSVDIHDNTIDHSSPGNRALFVEVSGESGEKVTATSLGGNAFEHDGGGAIYYNGGELPADVDENTATESGANNIAIGGFLAKSATWSDHGARISVLSQGITIAKANTLVAKPGLAFEGEGAVKVKGTLKAEGSAEDPVVFERQEYWAHFQGIVFEPGSGASLLSHVEVIKAGWSTEPAITINHASPHINHSVIRDSTKYGIFVEGGGNPEIDHNTITGSAGIGLYYGSAEGHAGELNIHDNTIENGHASNSALFIEVSGSSGENIAATSLGGNTIKGNYAGGIYYNGGELPPDIDENTVAENGEDTIWIGGILRQSATWSDPGVPIQISNSDLQIAKGTTLSADPGLILEGGGAVVVKGTLKAEGSAEDPVVFRKQAGASYFRGLIFEPGSGASILDHSEVIKAGYPWEPAVTVDNASPHITHSTVRESQRQGIVVKHGGSPEIDHNTLSNNYMGVSFFEPAGNAGEINIHDNTIDHSWSSGSGIYVEISGSGGSNITSTSLGGNIITEGKGGGLYFNAVENELAPDIDNNEVITNAENNLTFSGVLKKSTTWTSSALPLELTNSGMTIPKGITLTLKPGVTIEGGGPVRIEGTLNAEGSAEWPVVFRKGHAYSEFSGLEFKSGSSASVLDHVEVAKAGRYWEWAVLIDGVSPHITNSVIRQSTRYGIFIEGGGSPEIDHNLITHSGGISVYYGSAEGKAGEVNIHDNKIEYGLASSSALYVEVSDEGGENVTATSLGGNTIAYNYDGAIYYNGGELPPDIDENTLASNGSDAIAVSGVLSQSATWTDYGSPIQVSNLEIASGTTLTATQGLSFEGGTFVIKGTLKAEGTFEEPVVFQPHEKGSWRGLLFEPGSSGSVLHYAEVVGGGSGLSEAAVTINESSPTITSSTFRESAPKAIAVESGSPVIEWNLFRDNPYGLTYGGKGSLSAPNNDWQCNPESKSCGNLVSESVEWKPAAALPEFKAPCVAGSSHPGPRPDYLLYRYEPELVFDTAERFHPDSAAEIFENWGDDGGIWGENVAIAYYNRLLDGDASEEAVSIAGPAVRGEFHLGLEALGSEYPNGLTADGNDWIEEQLPFGTEEEVVDAQQNIAVDLEERGYKDHSYGLLREDGGHVWLEYWYWYYFNAHEFAGVGLHEGDWESILIRLDSEDKPDLVVFSQHDGQRKCSIESKEVDLTKAGAPISYVAKGSHANYFKPGKYELIAGFDNANGEGWHITPKLENLGRTHPSWPEWPGHWGNSRGAVESPEGPGLHEAWSEPDAYAEGASTC